MMINTNVGRNPDQQFTCICHMPRWQPYVSLTKTGRRMVMTTDAICLENIHAQTILELQTGFRPGFAPCLPGKSYQDSFIFSLLAIPSPYVVVLTYMIRIFNVGGGN